MRNRILLKLALAGAIGAATGANATPVAPETNGSAETVLARHGADDPGTHDARDDRNRRGRHAADESNILARHGADDPGTHDARDDRNRRG